MAHVSSENNLIYPLNEMLYEKKFPNDMRAIIELSIALTEFVLLTVKSKFVEESFTSFRRNIYPVYLDMQEI